MFTADHNQTPNLVADSLLLQDLNITLTRQRTAGLGLVRFLSTSLKYPRPRQFSKSNITK